MASLAADDDDKELDTKWLDDGEERDVGRLPQFAMPSLSSTTATKREPYFFISHTGKDGVKEEIARPTHWFLKEKLGVRAFLDDAETQVGDDKVEAMARPAYECTDALVLLSPTFREREFCVKELNTFMHRRRRWQKQQDNGEEQLGSSIRVIVALWRLSDLKGKGYHKDVNDLIWIAYSKTSSAAYYMVKKLWPELRRVLGRTAMKEDELQALFVTYVDTHLGGPRPIPNDFIQQAEDWRAPREDPPAISPTSSLGVKQLPPRPILPDNPDLEDWRRQWILWAAFCGLAIIIAISNMGLFVTYGGPQTSPNDFIQQDKDWRAASLGVKPLPPQPILPDNPDLLGRQEILQHLNCSLKDSGKMAALVGGAGTGKSHCAKVFVRRWMEEDRTKRTAFWLWAGTETNLRVSYLKLTDRLELTPDKEQGGDIRTRDLARLIWEKLETAPFEWMLVFDNVPESIDGPSTFAPWFFPLERMRQSWGSGRILLTTRSRAYSGRTCIGDVERIGVGLLDKETATKMLLKGIIHKDDDIASDKLVAESTAAAEELVDKRFFDGLPLAIATASAEIVDKEMTVLQYLTDLRDGLSSSGGVTDAVAAATASSLNHARENGLAAVLDIVAFVNPDRIPLELLGSDKVIVQHLVKLNLLRRVEDNVYSIHRLHQEAAQKGGSVEEAVIAVDSRFSQVFDGNNSTTWRMGLDMLPHSESLSNSVKEQIGGLSSNEHQLTFARIRHTTGLVLFVFQSYHDALAKYKEALDMKQHVYGPNSRNTDLASTLNNLGLLCSELGNYEEARSMHEEALDMKRHVYGANAKNANLAATLDNLGLLYMNLGNFEEACAKFEEALDMKLHVYGADAKNADLALTLGNLGILYSDLGNYEEAYAKYEEALDMKWHVYGANAKNADLAITLDSLGNLYRNVGKYEEARARYKEALDMQWHVYGANAKNADLALTVGNLGTLYMNLGNYEEARAMYKEALDMKQHVYGANAKNADLAATLLNLGVLYKDLGNYEEARATFEEALDMQWHVYGANAKNDNLATTLGNLGTLYQNLGNYEEARAQYNKSLDMKWHVYGANAKNADLASTLVNLGNLYMDLGNYEEARAKYEEALDMKLHVYGANAKNADLARTLNNLGILYMNLGNYEEARAQFEEALDMMQHVYGANAKNADLAKTLDNLGILSQHLGNYEEARAMYEQTLNMKRHVYGANAKNADLATTFVNLGNLHVHLGNYEKARAMYEEACGMFSASLGEAASSHPHVQQVCRNMEELDHLQRDDEGTSTTTTRGSRGGNEDCCRSIQ